MSLFARGMWSIFGIRKASQTSFEATIQSDKLQQISQAVVFSRVKVEGGSAFGINPYEFPRLDEQGDQTFTADLLKLDDGVYGFWGIVNGFEDVTDPKSKAEALAYKDAGRPFRFLSKDEKKVVEASVIASAVLSRAQFPVLVDFNSETVYAASGNADEVGMVRSIITALGGEDFSLAWQFDTPDWPTKFLDTVAGKNKFEAEMATRADELTRFRPDEVEKLDDRVLENIVANYFSMSELETGLWAGLSTPARIRLCRTGDPLSASSPSTAFSVLHEFGKSEVAGAAVVFQSLDSRFNKKTDKETQFRTNLFTIDVNDNINLTDAGAAMLRGFDLPTFKREMKQAAKNRSLTIGDYWKEWLLKMKEAVLLFTDNATETLKTDPKKCGLKPYDGETSKDA